MESVSLPHVIETCKDIALNVRDYLILALCECMKVTSDYVSIIHVYWLYRIRKIQTIVACISKMAKFKEMGNAIIVS